MNSPGVVLRMEAAKRLEKLEFVALNSDHCLKLQDDGKNFSPAIKLKQKKTIEKISLSANANHKI